MSRRVDPILLVAVLALTTLGVVMVYSASAVFAAERFGDPAHFLTRQLAALGAGLVAMAVILKVGHRVLVVFGPLLLLLSIAALVLVFLPGVGRSAGGATRWVQLGPVGFQPSELARLGLVIYLAASLARKRERMHDFKAGFLGPVLVAGVPILLVLFQPDFGTAVTMGLLLAVMLFLAGTRLTWLLGAAAVAAPVVVWLVAGTAYRMRRLVAFLDPWATRHDAGYQVFESLISIGSGGITGVGLGDGRQKLFFLPEAHTDFVFSIIGEELGLLGTLGVIALFGVLVWRGLKAAFAAEDAFGAYLALGLTSALGLQAALNLGVAMGLLPTKGLPLPFVSYGGTSLVLSLVSAALLLSVSAGQGGFLKPAPGAPR